MELYLPNFDVNEEEATITHVYVKDGEYVNKDDCIVEVENTKAVKDILAPESGYVKICCDKFDVKKTGELLAVFFQNQQDYANYVEEMKDNSEAEDAPAVNATKKAVELAQQMKISIEDVAREKKSGVVKTEDVKAYAETHGEKSGRGIPRRINKYDRERVVIIGAGKGAEIVIDILLDDIDKYVVGLVDTYEKEFESYSCPLLPCTAYDFADVIDRHQYDTVIMSIGSTLKTMQFRKELFESYVQKEVKFTNAIAKDANIRRAVKIGVNNVIMHNCYIGTGTEIGDNNMISYGMNLGHHCVMGSHNLIAPSFTTAGCVEIGSECIIMTGVNTRSFTKIGNKVVLPVGYAVEEDIADNSIIQSNPKGKVRN